MADKITRYGDFWPFYLRQHAKPLTRHIHVAGTLLVMAVLIAAFASGHPWAAFWALLAGYGPAWFAHFMIEKNRPATITYPFWSLISDFRMSGLWLLGQLDKELARSGVKSSPPAGIEP